MLSLWPLTRPLQALLRGNLDCSEPKGWAQEDANDSFPSQQQATQSLLGDIVVLSTYTPEYVGGLSNGAHRSHSEGQREVGEQRVGPLVDDDLFRSPPICGASTPAFQSRQFET